MSRTNRFLAGISLGYSSQLAIMLGGLWMTPFLLRHLGQADYGIWLLSLQTLGYLGLAEFGVVALLPRDVAAISGSAADEGSGIALRQHLEGALGLITFQGVFVALAAVGLWLWTPQAWRPIKALIGIVLAAYVLLFPFKLFQATLEGLQRQAQIATIGTAAWFIGFCMNIMLVWRGFGLAGVAVGWILSQTISVAACGVYLSWKFPEIFPRSITWPSLKSAKTSLGRGSWLSLQQIAQILLSGTDLMIIGKTLGPALIVPYSCTSKMNSIMSNQPGMLMQTAIPGLSQLRSMQSKERILSVTVALSLGMMLLSGACASVFLGTNEFFVKAWVGPSQYAGFTLTLLLTVLTVSRHFNMTFAYTAFSFGYERRMCSVAILEGVTSLLLSILLTRFWGLYGIVVGPLCALCLTSLASNIFVVSRDLNQSAYRLLLPLWPWFYRFVLISCCAVVAGKILHPSTIPLTMLLGAVIGAIYFAVIIPVMMRSPLGEYLQPKLISLKTVVRSFSLSLLTWRREVADRG